MKKYNVNNLILAGGVAANSGIRESFEELSKKEGFKFSYPSIKYCTDNATMIATAGYFMYQKKHFSNMELNAKSSIKLENL